MTMMNIKTNKKAGKAGIICLLVLLAVIIINNVSSRKDIKLEVFEYEQGWGYQILIHSKVFIYQPTIPAIQTNQSFPDQRSARKVGLYVMKKIKAGKDFTLSMEDINKILVQ